MQRLANRSSRWLQVLRRRPLKSGALIAGLMLVVGTPLFFLPKSVEFSYAEATCTKELTLFPQIHKQSTDTSYEVSFSDRTEVAGVALAAGTTCFSPLELPRPGEVKIATSPWGSWLASQAYTLKVGQVPKVDAAAFRQPLPTTKPVTVQLDQPDSLHQYELVIEERSTTCNDSRSATLECDIEKLELDQGKKYPYKLARHFNQTEIEPVSAGTLETLKAVKVVKDSLKNDQIVYDKPKSFEFEFDKPIVSAEAILKTDKASIPVETTTSDETVTVKLDAELDRETKYSLTVDGVEASDGSTLVDPHELSFQTSGGPKVTGVSIGNSRVDPSAPAVITFDQELSPEQDVTKLVSVKGGEASVSKLNSRQVSVQLGSLGRCVPFSITVAEGVVSKHDIKNDDAWSHQSRTICYTTSVYGASLQGRPLVAYHFGNSGPVTLYTGAIHGNEVSSKFMMESWIAELEAKPDRIGNRQVVVIPSINPDGVVAGTRNNSRNVNLSRNFPTSNWVKDIDDTNGRNKGGGGTKPLSEPEAAALARFTQSLRPRLLLSYHAVGSMVIGDPGGYSAGKASQYAGAVGYRDATGAGGTFDYDITGSFEEWTYHNVGIPSMVIELGSYSYHNFGHHRAAMWAMLD